jgi:hypothetical protein
MKAIALILLALIFAPAAARAQAVTTPYHLIAANTNNSTLVAAGAHGVFSIQVSGINAAPAYLKFYDKATAPTCGTDTPIKVIVIPAAATAANGGLSNPAIPLGVKFKLGLGFCVVTGIADNDNTSPTAANYNVNFDYQ